MTIASLDKRLKTLEKNSVCRIETLADLVRWVANPNRDPDPEFSPEMRECVATSRERHRAFCQSRATDIE